MKQIYILTLAGACLLSSCYTANRAARQMLKAQRRQPATVAAYCGQLYPPLVFTRDSIVYRQGGVAYLPGDTLRIDCDSVREAGAASLVQLPCPPRMYRVDTIYQYHERQVENRARLEALEHGKAVLQSRVAGLLARNSIYFWWAIAVTLVLAVGAVLRLRA